MDKKMLKKWYFLGIFCMFLAVFCTFLQQNFVVAETLAIQGSSPLSEHLDKIINANDLSTSSVVSVKILDMEGNCLYNRNSSLLLKPASTLKIPISALALKVLNPNYQIKTSLYKKGDNLFLHLSGDPTLQSSDLVQLFENIDLQKYSKLLIDTSSIDNCYLNKGWMWENLISSDNVPVSIFNLDKNTLNLHLSIAGSVPIVTSDYPLAFVNELTVGDFNCIKIEKRPWMEFVNPDTVYISGIINTPCEQSIAVSSPEKYFLYRLNQVLQSNQSSKTLPEIYYGNVPKGAKLLACHKTSLLEILSKMNTQSDNLCAETIFKIATGKALGQQGNFSDARAFFEEFYNTKEFVLYDASGLSHKNLINCDFLCRVLYEMKKDKNFLNTLAISGKTGTLKNRLQNVNLQGKTGTIDGVSGLCGYLDNKYIFAILIQNYKGSSKPAKILEDDIVLELNNFCKH